MDLINVNTEKHEKNPESNLSCGLLDIIGMNMPSVCAHDLEKSLDFYCCFLGFVKVRAFGRGYVIWHPILDLNVFLEGGYNKVDVYLNPARVSLNFKSSFGVTKVIQILKEHQIPIFGQYTNRDQSIASVQFEDPSNNLIEISGCP